MSSTNHQAARANAKLPDEVLCSIISHIPSLRNKFKLAAVNTKFRRCVNKQLTRPMPLDINFSDRRLNGDAISAHKIADAIEALAPKTHFNRISIADGHMPIDAEHLERLLSILAESESLGLVRSFCGTLTRAVPPCHASVLAAVLAKCPKLSVLRLDFPLCPPERDWRSPFLRDASTVDLGSVVANKPLTQLKIELSEYRQEDLVDLFRSLEPNTLVTLDVTLTRTLANLLTPTPNLADLLTNSRAAWSALREIRLKKNSVWFDTSTLLSGLFGTVLPQLPLVHTCTFEQYLSPTTEELVAGLMVLFNNNRERQQPIVVQLVFSSYTQRGCGMVDLIGQLKQVHPGLQVDFQEWKFSLELDDVICGVAPAWLFRCDSDCLQCGWVHPVMVRQLKEEGAKKESVHLPNCRLDRCKVDRVLTDLNEYESIGIPCRALFAAVNWTGDLVVIAFEDGDGDQFYITLDRAHCLSGGCIGCVDI